MYRLSIVCLFVVFLAGCASSPQSRAPESYTHEQAIEVRLANLGASDLAMKSLRIAAEKSKSETPLRVEFYDCVFDNINAQTLNEMMLPVYKKYYTKEDALEIIALLSTPLGKKFKTSVQNAASPDQPAVVFTPEENREFAKYARLFQGPAITKMNEELKQEGKRIGMEKAKPCVKYLKAS